MQVEFGHPLIMLLVLVGLGWYAVSTVRAFVKGRASDRYFKASLARLRQRAGVSVTKRKGGVEKLWASWEEVVYKGVTVELHYFKARHQERSLQMRAKLSRVVGQGFSLNRRDLLDFVDGERVLTGDPQMDKAVTIRGGLTEAQRGRISAGPLREAIDDALKDFHLTVEDREVRFFLSGYPLKFGGLEAVLERLVSLTKQFEELFAMHSRPVQESMSESWESSTRPW